MDEKILHFIDGQRSKYPQLCHANNIFVKLSDKSLSPKQKQALEDIICQYYTYLKVNMSLAG